MDPGVRADLLLGLELGGACGVPDRVGRVGLSSETEDLGAGKLNVQVTKCHLGWEPQVQGGPSLVGHRLGGHRAPPKGGSRSQQCPGFLRPKRGLPLPHTLGSFLLLQRPITLKTNAVGMHPGPQAGSRFQCSVPLEFE